MKILIDARMYGLEHSGIGRYIFNLTEELKSLKTEKQFIILLRKKYFNKLKFPDNWKQVLADVSHYSLEEQVKLPRLIFNEKADLVHFPHINYPILYRGKHIITIHDLTMQRQGVNATTLPLPIYFLKRIPFLLSARVGIKTAVAVIVPSKTVKDDVFRYYRIAKNKIHITYEGVSTPVVNKKSEIIQTKLLTVWDLKIKKYFFYVGNAYPHKNLELVIKAIKKLNEKSGLNFKFAVAGSKDVFLERLWELVKKENAEKYVKILGYVSDEELKILYKNSIAFIYPSFSEGFGLQGLEAMAAETLVLASDIPTFKEVYKDNVLYFDPKKLNSLIKVMKIVINMAHSERSVKINSAKNFIKRYSWQKMAKQTIEVYKQAFVRK